jgi:hypothetical protein
VKLLLSIYNWLRKNVKLPSAFSWQTLIILCMFSWYMALLARLSEPDGWVGHLLVNFGWIFLILGVFWGTTSSNQLRIGYKTPAQPGFPLSPWITGALVSIYLFGVLGEQTGAFAPEMLIYWPIISAIICIVPEYIGPGFKLKIPSPEKRKNQAIIFVSQILVSCWFQFHFLIQNQYLAQYPTLVADEFNRSAFVVKWEGPLSTQVPRGASILDAMEPQLRAQLEGKSWPVVEKMLLPKEREKLVNTTAAQARKRLTPVLEDELWLVTSSASQKGSGYNLDLRASWQGPRSKNQPPVTKSCQITQAPRNANAATKPLNTSEAALSQTISRFDCQPLKGWGVEEAIISQLNS